MSKVCQIPLSRKGDLDDLIFVHILKLTFKLHVQDHKACVTFAKHDGTLMDQHINPIINWSDYLQQQGETPELVTLHISLLTLGYTSHDSILAPILLGQDLMDAMGKP